MKLTFIQKISNHYIRDRQFVFCIITVTFLLFSYHAFSQKRSLKTGGQAKDITIYAAQKIISMSTVNDSIYTTNPGIAVDTSGKIAGVGDISSLQQQFSKRNVYVDNTFASSVILPGFIEAHSHFQPYGMYAKLPYTGYYTRPGLTDSLQGITSYSGIISYLKTVLQQNPGVPLFASGADPIYFKGSRFTTALLDSVSTTIPILMQLGSGHILICNTVMLTILENTTGWSQLPFGTVVCYLGSTQPTGEIDESAGEMFAFSVFNTVYKQYSGTDFFSPGRITQGIVDAGTLMSRAGITTATDLLVTGNSLSEMAAYMGAYVYVRDTERIAFPVRVVLAYDGYALYNNALHSGDAAYTFLKAQQVFDNADVRTGPVKFVLDGSIQGYTAFATDTFINPPSNRFWNLPPAQLQSLLEIYNKKGFPVAIHANGDSAINVLVQALQNINGQKNVSGTTWATIEHAQMISANTFSKIQAIPGVGLNLFPNHINLYGSEHALYTVGVPWVTIMENAGKADSLGIHYSFHSDAPVTPALPLFAAWCAVNRITAASPQNAFSDTVLGNTISVQKALHAITIGAAGLLNMDNEIGSLDTGKWADFAILQSDPYSVPPQQLKDIVVKGTLKGGVYFSANNTNATLKEKRKNTK